MRLFTALLLLGVLAGPARLAGAADQTVNDCSNDLELRADLASMQQTDGGTLTFSCPTSSIVLTSVLPDITKSTKIDGGGKITLSGGNASRILFVQASGTLEIEDLVLTNGSSTGDGGAIFSFGVLTLRSVEIKNSLTALSGGALVTYGPLTVEDSVFSGNKGANGGAVYARFPPAEVTIHDSVFHHNETLERTTGLGGAILLWDGASVTIDGSSFYENHGAQGGAISNPFTNSSVTISGSSFERNIAGFDGFEPDFHSGGAVFGLGTLHIVTSTFTDNSSRRFGGAIYAGGGAFTVEDSMIRGNTAVEGGGIQIVEDSSATVRRSTIYDNTAGTGGGVSLFFDNVALFENVTFAANQSEAGAALYNLQSVVTLSNSTVHSNQAGSATLGIGIEEATLSLRNTIVSGNSGFNCSDHDGLLSLDGNLSDDDSCSFALTGLHDANGSAQDPLLVVSESDATYGIVYVPQQGSPAIDAGVSTGAPSHDQRNVSRPQRDAIDRGAVEVAGCPEDVVCGDATADGDVLAADALQALRTAVGTSSCPLWRCDYNGDDTTTASDALAILRKAVGQNPAPECPVPWDCVD